MDTNLPHTASRKQAYRDFFLYLLTIITLYISVGAFITLYFNYIDVLLPDQLEYYLAPFDPIRLGMAMLIIVFPVYVSLSYFLRKDIIANPEKKEFGMRKFLIYFTLFVAALVIIIDLITLLNNFLRGDLTLRFFLKVVVVLFVAAALFSYYMWDLRRETTPTSKPSKLLAWIVSIFIAASVIAGFFVVGSPATQRKIRFDDRRMNDLVNIQSQVIDYWVRHDVLPANLDALRSDITGYVAPVDPESEAQYAYNITAKLSFELCATFNLETPAYQRSDNMARPYYGPYGDSYINNNWEHHAGETCFQRTIDPAVYRNPQVEYVPKPVL